MTRPYDVELDQGNIPVPQIETDAGTSTMPWKGKDNAGYVDIQEPIERVTEALKQIETDHAYIHDGIAYKAYLEVGDLTGTTSTYYTLKTPADKYLHFKNLSLVALGGTCKVTIRRGTTANPIVFTENGTVNDGSAPAELTGPHNMNDTSTNTTGTVIKVGPTFDTAQDGEAWQIIKVVGDGTNQFTSVAETQGVRTEELVFKPDTYYIIEVENVANDADEVLLTLFWYEEDDA